MSPKYAMELIAREVKYVQNSDEFDELEIDFMGGEPLMNFDLIKYVVETLASNPPPIPFICFATTNGTLLTPERKEWFEKYADYVWLGASYDGNPEAQKINRGLDEHRVDYEFFHKVWPLQGFKLTISKESLPTLASGIISAQKKGYALAASLAQGVDWTDEDAMEYSRQLKILEEEYLKDETLRPINLLTRSLEGLNKLSEPQCRFCGSGHGMITYDVDGTRYGCHMFAPITLGDKALPLEKTSFKTNDFEDPHCANCCLKQYCPTCLGFNYRYRGNMAKRDIRWCKMILAEALASCEFQIRVLTSRREKLNEVEAYYAQYALKAYPLLSQFSMATSQSPYVIC